MNFPGIPRIGDGICDDQFNIPECGYDENDCCPYDEKDRRFGDGMCHGGYFSSGFCYYDRSDCDDFRRSYPLCPLNEIAEQIGVDGKPSILDKLYRQCINQYLELSLFTRQVYYSILAQRMGSVTALSIT